MENVCSKKAHNKIVGNGAMNMYKKEIKGKYNFVKNKKYIKYIIYIIYIHMEKKKKKSTKWWSIESRILISQIFKPITTLPILISNWKCESRCSNVQLMVYFSISLAICIEIFITPFS